MNRNAPSEISHGDRMHPTVWRIAAVVFLGPFMTQLDSTVVNVSLSNIRDDLHSSLAAAQWVVSAYLLALALMLPLNGWLVDRIGSKRLYLSSFAAFTLASLFCATAQTMNQLIVARVLQGMAGGLIAPMTQMMLARVAGRHLAKVMGYTSIPILIAPLVGPVLAGAILKSAAWPWLFYINLPIGALALALAFFLLPHDTVPAQKRRFDFFGFVMISPGLACLLYGLERVSHGEGATIAWVGVIFLVAFIWDALRKKNEALIDLRLFKIQIFTTATRTQFLFNGLMFGGQFLIPLYLIMGCGLSASAAGWLLAPTGLGLMCVFPFMGFLTERFGCRAVSAGGTALALLGTLPFLWMIQTDFSSTLVAICLFVRGAGQGAIGIPSLAAAYASLPKDQLATGTTAMNIVQRLGGPIATTSLAIVMSVSARSVSATGPHTFMISFMAFIALHLILLASAWRLPLRVHQTASTKV